MELDPDLRIARKNLEKSISKYKGFAIAFAVLTALPFIIAAFYNFTNPQYLTMEETGSYVGGFSAPFASLSGILFVYVAFLGQRLQLIYQQQDLRTNQKELQQTREELRGQKEQLVLQNQQFEKQSFENTFFNLLNYHKQLIGDGNDILQVYQKFRAEIRSTVLFEFIPDGYGGSERKKKEGATLHDINPDLIKTIFKTHLSINTFLLAKIIKSHLSIVKHIDSNSLNPDTYRNILKLHLSHEELFVSFYYYAITIDRFSAEEQMHYYEFANNNLKGIVIFDYHIDWIQAIQHPNI